MTAQPFLVIGQPGHEDVPDPQRDAEVRNMPRHRKDVGIVFAGELPVAFRVDLLQVENDQTGGLHQPVETGQIIRVIGPEGLPGGIQSRVHAFGAGQLEECRQEHKNCRKFPKSRRISIKQFLETNKI